MDVNKSLLDAVFNHLVLPPKLPNQADGQGTASIIQYLETRLLRACATLQTVGDIKAWGILVVSLRATFTLDPTSLSKDSILCKFTELISEDATHWLVLNISGQNAALLIYYDHEHGTVVFEAFRTAAPSSTLLEANHALSWDFPDRAVAIPIETFRKESFLDNLCRFLEQGSSEAFDRFAARAQKGGKSVVETRDCPSPSLITDMLMSLLEGLGDPVDVCTINKKVRDDIVLGTSEGPWRRLPYWLVLRVAVRRLLSAAFEADEPGVDRVYYKFLIVTMMSHFLQDSVGMIHPEKALMLQAKVCRRLAKLENERLVASGKLREVYDVFFTSTSATLEGIVADARRRMTAAWESFKRKNIRTIPLLPRRAGDDDRVLQLPNSRERLQRLMFQTLEVPKRHTSLALPPLGEETVSQVAKLATQYAELIDYETRVTDTPDPDWDSSEQRCTERAANILHYLLKVDGKYAGDAILMSQHLLRLFELWMDMDGAATKACPLLLKYHPVFVPRALDVLCLTTTAEMSRLARVQRYLSNRVKSHSEPHGSIFDKPHATLAFPSQFVHCTPQGVSMLIIAGNIDSASNTTKLRKAQELEQLAKEYKDLTRDIESGACVCTRNPDGSRDVRGCRRCWKWRTRARLAITTHEDFLPSQDTESSRAHRAAILFELQMPRHLRAYRLATWQLRLLGNQIPSGGQRVPVANLSEFEPLMRFWASGPGQERSKQTLGLSSITKFFSRTHYQKAKLPTTTSEIMLPFGAELTYYDTESGFWAENLATVPWFEHLLGSWVPRGVHNPYADPDIESSAPHDVYGPSSYEIAADEYKYPAGISPHEFSALQRVISGRGRRWLVLLVELGATNINFSCETAMALLNHVAIQAGPAVKETGVLREAHMVFNDDSFCRRLHEQISARLDGLASSWRESSCMSIMITFALRLHRLCPGHLRDLPSNLLSRIRSITCSWIAHLRNEVRSACDATVAQKAASYAFWAALLCRQTFVVFDSGSNTRSSPTGDDLLCFFRASIAMQENLLINLEELSPLVRRLLIRDLSMSYIMRGEIRGWLAKHRTKLEAAINETWTDVGASTKRSFSPWAALPQSNDWWVVSKVAATKAAGEQVVHYHLLQGHLLVDGKPLGRLPLDMREDPGIQELFGKQHLLTRPSALTGMEYQLVNDIQNHQIHFGHRDGKVLIRAQFGGSIFEFVPRDIFRGPSEADLPSALVDDCVHWLNLHTGMVEMRRAPAIWRQKHSNWVLDTRRSLAVRNKGKPLRGPKGRNSQSGTHPGSYLVEPRSEVGLQIAAILGNFEEPYRLTIFQSAALKAPLSVEMKRLEIKFEINYRGLLFCPQLRSEVDPNQDPGTLYGLTSGVILRSVKNFGRKSIIVPMGQFAYQRKGMHVAVTISNEGEYARFNIDPTLGRLVCPPEPALLYLKAALHASTSFPLPDNLTGRTGTEEALHCLSSARAQPWQPLNRLPLRLLRVLQDLSPRREYYPPGKQSYQKVVWNDNITMTIQHEALAVSVRDILQQSQKLETFKLLPDAPHEVSIQDVVMGKLALRGAIRRQVYERITSTSDTEILDNAAEPTLYRPTEGHYPLKESCQVYRTVKALLDDNAGVPQLPPLESLLHRWNLIGGFAEDSPVLNVGELLEADFRLSWGSFVQACRQGQLPSSYDALFKLAVLAFSEKADMSILYWLITIAKNTNLQEIQPPLHSLFTDFKANEEPDEDTLAALLAMEQPNHGVYRGVARSRPATRTGPLPNKNEYEEGLRLEARRMAAFLMEQWPVELKTLDDLQSATEELEIQFVDMETAWGFLEPEIQRISRNVDLSAYIARLANAAKLISEEVRDGKTSRVPTWTLRPMFRAESSPTNPAIYQVPQLAGDLASKPYALPYKHFRLTTQDEVTTVPVSYGSIAVTNKNLPSPALETLHELVKELVSSSNPTRKQYGKDLQDSFTALVREYNTSKDGNVAATTVRLLKEDIAAARKALRQHLQTILGSLSMSSRDSRWLFAGNLWPCVAPVALLELLREDNVYGLGTGMKEALVWYGLHLTNLQRLLRMLDAYVCRDDKRLHEDQRNQGHTNWDPLDHPEWLLLEIDNDLLIRRPQIDVARAIIAPTSGQNSVLQMNMGQGKTSCIVPMAVIALADKESLCRLIVPRALLLQTAQVIQCRLGGLVGRVVRHIPFARRSPSGADHLDRYHEIHNATLESGGVMLCLPENILSFKLSGLQRLADDKLSIGRRMVEIQRWLDQSCRDIIDESDFTLSVKTQLIYPSGPQTIVDGHPYRWQAIQELLSLVEGHASELKAKFPSGIEIVQRHQGYPIIHFLQERVENKLNTLLVKDICAGRLPQLQLKNSDSEAARSIIRQIVSGGEVKAKTWATAAKSLTDSETGLKTLFLLRGVISHKIVILCLKKRWNVQYGLHPHRAPIAVPFEAKGIPSQTAEYGHPDTALILTCLAFYQTGLTKQQIGQSLLYVIRSDDPAAHYEHWVHGCDSLPAHLRHWNLLNADDEAQVAELWKFLRLDRNVLNHYMNNFVFPAHAKQFGVKLQASGWDIPLLSREPDSRQLTTGFSGTNDNKRMLPQTIRQDDLPNLLQTNAEVLGYLLEPRNQRCHEAVNRDSNRRLSEEGLLRLLWANEIRVLIDAGAHILEMGNAALASAWLDVDHEAKGAVYFDERSQIMVQAKFQKRPMPLLASPFADALEECVVYIDEAHTRGTDLKLPVRAKGALTLGLNQTKDQTVQAAMRLRQLGSTQSIAFVAPPEVYRSILDLRPGNMLHRATAPVTSTDVVRWLLEQSCKANENMTSLHVAQGLDFCRRTNAMWKNSKFLTNKVDRAGLLDVIRQQEDQTLEQLYGPRTIATDSASKTPQYDYTVLQGFMDNLQKQKTALAKSGRAAHSAAFEEVEQEREVEFEVEQVREKQRPVQLTALSFPGLDPAIVRFVETGILKPEGPFVQAFKYLGTTKIGKKFGVRETSSSFFVSREFTRTIAGDGSKTEQGVVRPVEWILWSVAETALVVTPEEAELLLPKLRAPKKRPLTRLLSYAAPVTKSMRAFSNLSYLTVPSTRQYQRPYPAWLAIEVGVLARRLYFDFREYKPLLAWLGVDDYDDTQEDKENAGEESAVDVGILGVPQPLAFMLEWLSHGRQSSDIMHTPMGYVCQRRGLVESHPFFARGVEEPADAALLSSGRVSGMDGAEEDSGVESGDSEWEEEEGLHGVHGGGGRQGDGLGDGLEDGPEEEELEDVEVAKGVSGRGEEDVYETEEEME